MNKTSILIAQLCLVLLAILLILALIAEDEAPAPEVNTAGLCLPQKATVSTASSAPEYKALYTDDDVTALAQMLWGEARGCSRDNQVKCVWVVLNRVDNEHYPDSIIEVVSQSGQFYGYSPYFPATDELKSVALDVLNRWSMEKQGAEVERELDADYLWFTGDGAQNRFRRAF